MAAARKHTATLGMQSAAKRGVKMATGLDGVDDLAMAAGKKLAAGQPLSDQHVRQMAAHHAVHGYDCPTDDKGVDGAEDLLWGGPAGAAWSAARCAAMDVSDLSDEDVPVNVFSGDEPVSIEVFASGVTLAEGFSYDAESDLVWAPILRSGTLATRPGPHGEKLHQPLVFIPGRSSDPQKEIGLQDLLDAYKETAVEFVTIPTTHANGVLENNGYVVDMRIDDSVKRPGQKVLMAAHRFTEPDVRDRVIRGSVASRSCGIAYDVVNTETGKSYPAAIDHAALTNRPWVRGMVPYGSDAFSDGRQVVSMLLSETPLTLASDSVAGGAWDGSAGRFSDEQYARSCVLDRGGTGTAKMRYSLPVREPDGTLNRNGVHAAAGMIHKIAGASAQVKRAAAKRLVALYRGPLKEDPPADLSKLAAVSTAMSEPDLRAELALADVQWGDEPSLDSIRGQVVALLSQMRAQGEPGGPPYYFVLDITPSKALVQVEYGTSDPDDAWVVPFQADATGAVTLSEFTQWTPVVREWVTDDDAAQDKDELASILGPGGMPTPDAGATTPLSGAAGPTDLRLAQSDQTRQGGAMTLTAQELARLELSDEARAVLQSTIDENATLRTNLAEQQKTARKAAVGARVAALQAAGMTPGFCAEYEAIALADDGAVAAVLHLSEGGAAPVAVNQTATQLAERLVAALLAPGEATKALPNTATLLESPINGRPGLTAHEQEKLEGRHPQTGDEMLAALEAAAPGSTAELRLAQPASKGA